MDNSAHQVKRVGQSIVCNCGLELDITDTDTVFTDLQRHVRENKGNIVLIDTLPTFPGLNGS